MELNLYVSLVKYNCDIQHWMIQKFLLTGNWLRCPLYVSISLLWCTYIKLCFMS